MIKLIFLFLFVGIYSQTLRGKVLNLPKDESPVSVTLDGRLKTYVRFDSTFEIHNMSYGSFLLQLDSTNYLYPIIRIDVNQAGKMRALSDGLEISIPLKLTTLSKIEYFSKPAPFDLWSLFMNPMGIMVILGIVMMILPKLVDPEALKEAQETFQQGEDSVRALAAGKKKKE